MANNPVVNSLTFVGSVAGQASIQSQGIAGNLTFLLPNIPPTLNQLLTATNIVGNNVFLGWSASQSSPSFSEISGQLALNQIAQGGATPNQILEWNGSQWAPASAVPGAGTVTSVTFTGDGTVLSSTPSSAVTTSGTLTATLASQTQNLVLASPNGSSGVPTFRKVAIADINSIEGAGSKVQTTSQVAATVSGHIVTYNDTVGTIADSGTLLSSLAPLASPALTGAVTITAGVGQTGLTVNCDPGSPVIINGNGGVALQINGELNVANNQTLLMGTGGHLFMSTSTLNDDGGAVGTSGQLLTSTGAGVHWISQSALAIAGGQVTGNISGNAASITGSITSSQVSDLAANTVTSFNSRQGIVAPQSGDYASFYDAVGAAATAQSNAEAFATSAVGVETSRAEGVEATLTSLQGNGSNGQPAASNNHVATGNNLSLPGTSLNSFITGSVSSGAFVGSETVTQANSGATATTATPPVDSLGRLIVVTSTIIGAPNATDIWTGGISTATFTPTAIPVAIDSASYGATVTLSAAAAYTATNMYSVLVSKLTNGGAHTGILFAQTVSGTNFTVFSSDSTDDSSIYWACFGKTAGD